MVLDVRGKLDPWGYILQISSGQNVELVVGFDLIYMWRKRSVGIYYIL